MNFPYSGTVFKRKLHWVCEFLLRGPIQMSNFVNFIEFFFANFKIFVKSRFRESSFGKDFSKLVKSLQSQTLLNEYPIEIVKLVC